MVSKALRAEMKPCASTSLFLLNQAFWNIGAGRAVRGYPVQFPHLTLEEMKVQRGWNDWPTITQLISSRKPNHHKKPGLWTPCSVHFSNCPLPFKRLSINTHKAPLVSGRSEKGKKRETVLPTFRPRTHMDTHHATLPSKPCAKQLQIREPAALGEWVRMPGKLQVNDFSMRRVSWPGGGKKRLKDL